MKRKKINNLSFRVLLTAFSLTFVVNAVSATAFYFINHDRVYNDETAQHLDTIDGLVSSGAVNILYVSMAPSLVSAYEAVNPEQMPAPGEKRKEYYAQIKEHLGASFIFLYNQLAPQIEFLLRGSSADYFTIAYIDEARGRVLSVLPARGPEAQAHDIYFGYFQDIPQGVHLAAGQTAFTYTSAEKGTNYSSFIFLQPPEGYSSNLSLFAFVETDAATLESRARVFLPLVALTGGLTILSLIAGLWLLIYFSITKRVSKITDDALAYTKALGEGKLIPTFSPSSNKHPTELDEVNDSFYRIQEALGDYSIRLESLVASRERINSDLELARKIQQAMLPHKPLRGEGVCFQGFAISAKEVGGDLYFARFVDDRHLLFFIGDVTGKGIPAALFMAKSLSTISLSLDLGHPLQDSLAKVNAALCAENDECLFVTAFVGVLDTKSLKLDYAYCGHEPAFLLHEKQVMVIEGEPNLPFGLDPDFAFSCESMTLSKKDRIFLYTDGLSEAMNASGELFGKGRIVQELEKAWDLPGVSLISSVREGAKDFVKDAPQSDDMCMAILDIAEGKELVIKADEKDFVNLAPFIDEALADLDPSSLAMTQVAMDELFNNIISYGQNPDGDVVLSFVSDSSGYLGALIDEGIPFDPLAEQEEKDPELPGGDGLILVKSFLKDLTYRRVHNKNVLTFRVGKK